MYCLADIAAPEAVSQVQEAARPISEGLPMAAVPLFHIGWFEVTNSALVSYIVAAILIVVAQLAMNKARLRPTGLQNFVEWLVESLNGMLHNILGADLNKKTGWFFSSIFIFILAANWFGLLPGVGTIGWGYQTDHGFEVTRAFIRGANADVNMTLSLALISFLLWMLWALQANGVWGTILHIFAPKGEHRGAMKVFLICVFFVVGLIEILSILVRPVSLTFRLFGNIFGGENMIDKMMGLVPSLSWLIPLPVYFFELLVGLVQALVFFLLTAVFTAMICRHDETHHKGKAHH